MRLLLASVWRHVTRSWGTWVSVPVLVCLAVAIYGGTYMGLDRVADSTDALYRDLSMFDLEVRVAQTTRFSVLREPELVARVEGLAAATWRTRAQGTLRQSDGATTAAAILTSLPGRRPDVADVLLTKGDWVRKDRPRHVVMDHTWALDHGIELGDEVDLRIEGLKVRATIGGIGVFPEHLLSSVDEHFSVPVRGSLVALLVSEGLLHREFMGRVPINDLVVTFEPGADADAVRDQLLETLDGAGLTTQKVVPRAEQYSVVCNQNRLTTFRDFLPTTIVLFDGLAALIALLTLRRLVDDWRRGAGVLLSFGVSRARLVLAWGVVIAALGTLGVVAGWFGAWILANIVASLYLDITGFPLLVADFRIGPLIEASAMAAVLLPLGCVPVVLGLLRPPVEQLRSNVAQLRSFVLPLRIPLPSAELLGLRNAMRRPGVSLVTTLSIAGTLIMSASLFVFGDAQWDNLESFVSARRWDSMVQFRQPLPASELRAMLTQRGFHTVEPLVLDQLVMRHEGDVQYHAVVGGSADSQLQLDGWLIFGRPLSGPQAPEILLGYRQARALGVGVGDRIDVEGSALEVVGIINAFMVDQGFVTTETLARLKGQANPAGALLAGPLEASQALNGDPSVALVLDGAAITEASLTSTGGFISLVRIYSLLGALAGFVVLVSALGTSLRDRLPEIAALRSQGVTVAFVTRAIAAEAAAFAFAGGLLSLPFVLWTCGIFQERIARTGMFVPLDNTSVMVAISLGTPPFFVALAAAPLVWSTLRQPLARSLSTRS